jgi:hypothetical protein
VQWFLRAKIIFVFQFQNMRALLSFLLLISASILCAQPPAERWKEVQRLNLKKKEQSYTDTMHLVVQGADINIRRGAFMYKGARAGRVLDMGYTSYGIVKDKDDELQLRDDDYIHVFRKELSQQTQPDPPAPDLPATPVSSIDTALLKGTWEAYKRSARKGPLDKVSYATLLKTMEYNTRKNEQGNFGALYNNYIGGKAVAYIRGTRAASILAKDEEGRDIQFQVWKLSADELIIEDSDGILYYMKHFR